MLKIHKQQHYFFAWWLSFLEEAFQVIEVEENTTIRSCSLICWDGQLQTIFRTHRVLFNREVTPCFKLHAVRYWHITEQNGKRASICREFPFFRIKISHNCDSTLYLQKPFSPCCPNRLWSQSQLNTTWRWLWVSVATYTAESSRPSP